MSKNFTKTSHSLHNACLALCIEHLWNSSTAEVLVALTKASLKVDNHNKQTLE